MTHCKEAMNLSTAPFHGLYFRFYHISLSPYGFRDHLRMPSDIGCYHNSNRLGLNSFYYQKTPRIIIKIYEKSGNFDKIQNYLSSGRQNTQKKGPYESPFELSYQGHVICFYRGWYSTAIWIHRAYSRMIYVVKNFWLICIMKISLLVLRFKT